MPILNPLDLPPVLASNILSAFGARGEAWLEALPHLLEQTSQRWNLTLSPAFEALSYNYVCPVRCADGSEAVLKLGVPDPELTSEIAALQLYAGRGAARLLQADAEKGALLLERLRPGRMLAEIEDDDRATEIGAEVMRALWRPALSENQFLTIEGWAAGLKKIPERYPQGSPLPRELVDLANGLFAELLPSQTARMVLHGDFHHYNVLSSGSGWLAIDPKGLLAEPEYEVTSFLRNPFDLVERPDALRVTERRIAILCERLGFDRKRVRQWAIAHAVLSAWWDVEFDGDASRASGSLRCAEIFQQVKI